MSAHTPVAAALCVAFSLAFVATAPRAATTSQYSTDGLYDVEHLTLDNGLQVILKPRGEAPNVSIRVSVGVGQKHFPCGSRETPHFLEHLLFAGTSRLDEVELGQEVEERGGIWNAWTEVYQTVYMLDIHSAHAAFGIDRVFEILTDSVISEEDVEISREIIHRESGGLPNALYRALYQRGVGKDAIDSALEAMNLNCAGFETALGITRNDIVAAFERAYVASNMTVIIVGDFERTPVLEHVRTTFGSLPTARVSIEPADRPVALEEPRRFTNTLSYFIGSDAAVGVLYATEGTRGPDAGALNVLSRMLSSRVYETLRVEHGLSYAPDAEYIANPDFGFFLVTSDVDPDDADIGLALIRAEVERAADATAFEDVNRARQAILLEWAQGMEANADFANYYAQSLYELDEDGEFVNLEARIEGVTATDVYDVARRLVRGSTAIELIDKPVLTYETASASGATVLAGTAGLGIWIRRRRR